MKKNTRLLILISCFLFFLGSIIVYHCVFASPKKTQPILKNDTKINKEKPKEKGENKLEKLQKLKQENQDLIGWIKIEDTNIDYPVMYTKGEDFYLYRDFYKNDLKSGTLFVDKYNNVIPRDINLIIYGHSMYDGTMFHDLFYYLEESFYQSHKTIEFDRIDSIDTYEVVSVFRSKVYRRKENVFKYYKFYRASSEEEYQNFITNIKQLELYETGVIPQYPEELITLSTCDDTRENGRFVVVAKKISEAKD